MAMFEKFKAKHRCPKVRFDNEFDAKKEGKKIGLRAYTCPYCYGYHLTSSKLKGGG